MFLKKEGKKKKRKKKFEFIFESPYLLSSQLPA